MNSFVAAFTQHKKCLLLFCGAFILLLALHTHAATYNLTSGQYPPCDTNSWGVSGTTYTCNGNGRVTLASGDILTSSTTITIVAANGFSLTSNTIGTSTNKINLTSSYGTVVSAGTNTVYGTIQGGSGTITLVGTTVSGAVTTGANINLTGGSVSGLVTSSSNTITTNNTSLLGGATCQSGMNISGGNLAGAFTLTSANTATFSNVVMASGSISGASTVSVTGSTLGSSSSTVSVTSTSGAVTLNSTTVYGNLTAPSYSTINVSSGSMVTGTCSPNSTPANACSTTPTCTTGLIGGLNGNYFSNMTLAGSPAGSRNDSNVNFDWGTGASGVTNIPADQFSVRWTGSLRAPSTGAYQFQTQSDDGVRLWIDNVLVIDNWTDHSVATNTSSAVNLTAGQSYAVKLEYYENGGYSVIKLLWNQPTDSSFTTITTQSGVVPDTSSYCAVPVQACNGLIGGAGGKYYNNTTLSGTPVSRVDSTIDFSWGTGAPGVTGIGADTFSVRWDSVIKVSTTGNYQFDTVSDDGVRLWVNNVLVIDNWTTHSATTNTTSAIALTAGVNYPIRLEYFENTGTATIQLHWKKPADSSYTTVNNCPSALTGYTVTSSTPGITCAGEPITFTAVDGAGTAFNPTAGTGVTLSTSPSTGVWVGGTGYTFNGSVSSFVRYLQQTTPATLSIGISDGTNTGSGSLAFVDSALKFYGDATLNSIQTQIAGVVSGDTLHGSVANNNPILKAIRTDNNTGACVAQITGAKSVNLAYECVNPTTCISGQTFTVNGTAVKANDKNATIIYLPQTLTFDNTGTANIPLYYTDVGQINLYAQTTLPATTNDPAKVLSATSNSFVVKPYTLAVSSVLTASGGSNPGATSLAGTANGFVAAGAPFQAKVEARKYPGATGDITPNFGRENVSEAVIKLVATSLVYPTGSGTTLTSITGSTSYSNTTPTGTWLNAGVIWDQVGSIKIQPEYGDLLPPLGPGPDYLGAGDLIVKTVSGTIGRFYPDHFSVSSSSSGYVCGTYSYLGQPNIKLNYQLQARDAAENLLSNYGTQYSPLLVTPVDVAENADSGNGSTFSGRLIEGASLTGSIGGTISLTSTAANVDRLAPTFGTEGPYSSLQWGLDITDNFDGRSLAGKNMNALATGTCSGAGCTAVAVGSSTLDLRYGRLRLEDAFGPETVVLPVNFFTEFWTGNHFTLNTQDSCTLVPRAAINYPAGSLSTDANRTVALTGGTTQGTYTNLNATGVSFNAGVAGQSFTAPTNSAQGTFVVSVDLTSNLSWLRFDWDQGKTTGPDLKLPNATFSFGSYRGNDRIIYWREKLQ